MLDKLLTQRLMQNWREELSQNIIVMITETRAIEKKMESQINLPHSGVPKQTLSMREDEFIKKEHKHNEFFKGIVMPQTIRLERNMQRPTHF